MFFSHQQFFKFPLTVNDLDLLFHTDLIKAWTAAEVTDGDAAMTTKGWGEK